MSVLYLSYDGMTDPLGQSQVIPYILGLATRGHAFHIISFEKRDRFLRTGGSVKGLLEGHGIGWTPLTYHKRPPILSTLWDIGVLVRTVDRLMATMAFQAIHCRSYITALVGLRVKKRTGVKFIFDMRGFWADERVEGGLWNLRKPLFRGIYAYFKRKEREFLKGSDSVVVLTQRSKNEVESWGTNSASLSVIPCCVDTSHFSPTRVEGYERESVRKQLGIHPDQFVIAYLGSFGTWYMADEMFQFFSLLRQRYPKARLLLITPETFERFCTLAERSGVTRDALCVRSVARGEVPVYLSVARMGLFFIKPCYSKMASCPTKMGEMLSMGLPIISNAAVGDLDWFFSTYQVGHLLHGFSEQDYRSAVDRIPELLGMSRESIRSAAEAYFSLDRGIEKYAEVYNGLAGGVEF